MKFASYKTYPRSLPTKLIRRTVGILMCLTGFLITVTTFLHNVPVSTQRPPSNITFMNKGLCAFTKVDGKSQKTAIIIVHSARYHFDRRQLIRQSYGSIFIVNNIQILGVVFTLGNTDAPGVNQTDTAKLQAEMDRFGDIVMGDFVDSYRNLTLKAIMGFQWLTTRCRQAKFLVKTDDDVVVNIFQLTKEIDSWSPRDIAAPNIWCPLHHNESTINDKTLRFYASPVDFPNGKFPDHCGGLGWVTTIEVIDQIVAEISRSYPGRVCTHDDVFMTGIVVRQINSMRNSSVQNIKLVDRYLKWISLALEDGRGDEDFFLRNLMKRSPYDIGLDNLAKFQLRYSQKTFYLLPHNNKFKYNFLWLWHIILKCFSE